MSDGYYWYLFPFFVEIHKETGQMIDLYGDADFHGEALPKLLLKINAVREQVLLQPECWKVETGEEQGLVPRKIYADVARSTFVSRLDSFCALIEEGITSNQHLIFIGD